MIAPLAHVEADVTVSCAALWAVLSDFAHPQRLVPSIEACTIEGAGPGAVRCVRSSRGLTIYERLIECDRRELRLVYEVLDRGDMPFAGVTSYRASVRLIALAAERTRVSWIAEGAVSGPREPVQEFLRTLYGDAIRALAAAALYKVQTA